MKIILVIAVLSALISGLLYCLGLAIKVLWNVEAFTGLFWRIVKVMIKVLLTISMLCAAVLAVWLVIYFLPRLLFT